jgi:hypothetical protein
MIARPHVLMDHMYNSLSFFNSELKFVLIYKLNFHVTSFSYGSNTRDVVGRVSCSRVTDITIFLFQFKLQICTHSWVKLLCYRVLIRAQHPWCREEGLPQPGHRCNSIHFSIQNSNTYSFMSQTFILQGFESASRSLVDFDVLNDSLIKWLTLCVKWISRL